MPKTDAAKLPIITFKPFISERGFELLANAVDHLQGAVSKWLKQAMRGSAFFRNILGQAKTECRKNGTQGIIFIRDSKWNEL